MRQGSAGWQLDVAMLLLHTIGWFACSSKRVHLVMVKLQEELPGLVC
jgi:hypothetical protein